MNGTSYLLAIDGSEESRNAANFTWELASQSGARVTAQHVVDTQAAWRFLSHDRAGFVGSGVYMEAREKITDALYAIAESIMLSYTCQIDSRALEYETYIDSGDPATEITRRAQQHDLVVMGLHDRRSLINSPRLFERVAQNCPCPILILANSNKSWSRMQICATYDIANQETAEKIYQFGSLLGLPTEVYVDDVSKQRASKCFSMGGWSKAFGVRSIENADPRQVIDASKTDSLIVLSADMVSGPSAAAYRECIQNRLEQSNTSLLLWRSSKSSHSSNRKIAS